MRLRSAGYPSKITGYRFDWTKKTELQTWLKLFGYLMETNQSELWSRIDFEFINYQLSWVDSSVFTPFII